MSVSAVQRALTRRVRALERDLPAALDNDIEALHRARVASRRLREILPVLALGDDSGRRAPVRKLRRRLRRLTFALGGVRELDVALGILEHLRRDHPDLGDVLSSAKASMDAERRECRSEMERQVESVRAGAMFEHLASLIAAAAHPPHTARVALLRRRLARRTRTLEAAASEAGSLFDLDRLHQVRVAAKKLRYVLELVHEFGRVPTLRLAGQLKQLQDLLGRLHDLVVVRGYIHRERRTRSRRYSDEIERASELLEREMRDLHASYMARLPVLGRIVSTCRGEVGRRLEGAPPAPRREEHRHAR
jgi:CHAD domain-containing protein